jgi:hypothetical protein
MWWRRVLAAGVILAVVTLLALEGDEVVQLRTTTPDGGVRTTRTWIADADGVLWLESANPERPFLRDVEARPDVELVRGGEVLRLRATPVPGEAGHRKIRQLLAAKYGWADRWVGLLTDTSRSVAVRLEPRAP